MALAMTKKSLRPDFRGATVTVLRIALSFLMMTGFLATLQLAPPFAVCLKKKESRQRGAGQAPAVPLQTARQTASSVEHGYLCKLYKAA